MTTKEKYWEKRGCEGYLYRNEYFYTITPVAFYYKRRDLRLEKLTEKIILISEKFNNLFNSSEGNTFFVFEKK